MDSFQQEIYNHDLFIRLREAVRKGVDLIQNRLAENGSITKHFSISKISSLPNGLPSFHQGLFGTIMDYSSPFNTLAYKGIAIDEIPEFVAFHDYIYSNDVLREYFLLGDSWDDSCTRMILHLPTSFVDRYMHLRGEQGSFDESAFYQIYQPFEAGIYLPSLPIDIVVPLALITFDFDSSDIGDNVAIERMEDGLQIARMTGADYIRDVHSIVLGAATHAVVFRGWQFPENTSYWKNRLVLSDNLLEFIDSFFAACRIVTTVDTGYAQVVTRPVRWALRYIANLPPLSTDTIRKYPMRFDQGGWLRPVPVITSQQAQSIGKTFANLQTIKENRITLAARRLNRCLLREDEEDSILDAAIALEMLLTPDSSTGEITHKLSLRIAALMQLDEANHQTANEIFQSLKKIYEYRSAIVHGNHKANTQKEIVLTESTKIPTVELAVDYLRKVLWLLLEHPEYLVAKNIDGELILSKLNNNQKDKT